MFPMTMTIHNAGQLNAVLMALQGVNPLAASDFKDPAVGAAYEEAAAKVEANAKAAPAGKPKAEKAAAAKTEAAAASKPGAAAEQTPAADALAKKDAESAEKLGVQGEPAAATYEDVKKAILEVSKQRGRDAAIKLLGEFGATKGPDLQQAPEHFAAFLARAKELLS